jgi:hypothetical protein
VDAVDEIINKETDKRTIGQINTQTDKERERNKNKMDKQIKKQTKTLIECRSEVELESG